MPIDLHPTAATVGGLLRALPDEALQRPTPCPDYSVGDLIDHVNSFCLGFTAAAKREVRDQRPPPGAVDRLPDDWREQIPQRLDELAGAWSDPAAWEGMTGVAGLELPGEVAGMIALDELVVHGWDLAVATGQPYDVAPEVLVPLHGFVEGFVGDGPPREGLFGAQVPVPDDAPVLHRILGLTGRDPAWTP
jgi:uncharacterized protein (TIGR03086 family)